MQLLNKSIRHIAKTAGIPSFSTYEERLHPYIRKVFSNIPESNEIEVPGNSLIFRVQNPESEYTLALTAHLDKINHYGADYPSELPVEIGNDYIEGAMDDCAGIGILLAIAEKSQAFNKKPELLFFFSEMEESKGLKEHPELLKNNGKGYKNGMGARKISQTCIERELIPNEIITVDTTPLFEGKSGVALYSEHWELNELEPSEKLIKKTRETVQQLKKLDPELFTANNTNDYLHYGYEFNKDSQQDVVSVALEPAIFPYHQKGERVFKSDIQRVSKLLVNYINAVG